MGISRAQTPAPSPSAAPSSAPTATPTQPPIGIIPANAFVPVGGTQTVRINSALGNLSVTVANPAIAEAAVDQETRIITFTGKLPGMTSATVTDQRGLSAAIPIRVAYYAGSIGEAASIRITGDPAGAQFVRERAAEAARSIATVRKDAQLVITPDLIEFNKPLQQDDVVTLNVPVLVQGEQYISVQGTTHVRVENLAAPVILPDSLMVSDYPERLTATGVLFAADVSHEGPSRFLYFHFNPPGQAARRLVLRAENRSVEPAILQFIYGSGGPGPNEMEVGHNATREFLEHQVQNEGKIIVLPANRSLNIAAQELPPGAVVCGLLQLRVLSGAVAHLTLFAQDADRSPDESIATEELLSGGQPHARGIYRIPEFHSARLWNVNEDYLELPVGDIPLPNLLQGQALGGDYGVKQSFVVKVQNPTPHPQAIAIYENPRGGRASGTFIIDGILVQSHGVPAFSRYKIRQYVVPARGFLRITIVTVPDSGSSYPLRLVFAPDDGSVAPGAPGSPVY